MKGGGGDNEAATRLQKQTTHSLIRSASVFCDNLQDLFVLKKPHLLLGDTTLQREENRKVLREEEGVGVYRSFNFVVAGLSSKQEVGGDMWE